MEPYKRGGLWPGKTPHWALYTILLEDEPVAAIDMAERWDFIDQSMANSALRRLWEADYASYEKDTSRYQNPNVYELTREGLSLLHEMGRPEEQPQNSSLSGHHKPPSYPKY